MKTIKKLWKTYKYNDVVRTHVNFILYWTFVWVIVIMVIVFKN